jgi:phosphoadenosine phosphosulfate reductase
MTSEVLTQALFDNDESSLLEINQQLEKLDAIERIHWSLQHLPDTQILSSSFGIQSAVMLHLLTSIKPDIPVVLIDTGYLFAETYQFIDSMTQRLDLNLQVYRSKLSPAWQEARYGELWAQGLEGLKQYNHINKVEPMQRALAQLNVGSWYAGLRRQQANSRAELPVLKVQNGRFKMHPIIDWSNRDVHQYLTQHNLPYHPLWERGYVSVGDHHSSRPLELGMSEEETRFSGLKRECGLHE